MYPAHTLLGSNVLPFSGSNASLSPASSHYNNAAAVAYEFAANQYNQQQQQQQSSLDTNSSSFSYGASQALAAAVASNPNLANYAYAALAQQASLPSLTTSFQQ